MLLDQAQALRNLVAEAQTASSDVASTDGTPTAESRSQPRPQRPESPLAARRPCRIIAITSGKGGVGKTNVSVNLSIRLSQLGRRVVLIDADLGTANADVLCNLPTGRTLAHVVAGRKTLQQAMIEAPGGFRLIAGASGVANMAALSEFERRRLVEQMRQLDDLADLVLIDTGAGVSPNVLSFLAGADQQLVITTPEPTALTDAYAVIKAMSRQIASPQISVLVNMARSEGEAKQVFERIDAVSRRFLQLPVRYAGFLPFDARVGAAVRRRVPFVLEAPGCEASVGITQLSHRLDRFACEPRSGGLWSRMAAWFTR